MLKAFSITDVGRKRKLNEDFVCAKTEKTGALPNFFIVADGMGGHKAGDRASMETVGTMLQSIENAKEKEPKDILYSALMAANLKVFQDASKSPELEGMGTTVVAATICGQKLIAMNVGDSRLYLISDGEIRQITNDHSLVEEMVRNGVIPKERARNHPKKNIITRAVGVGSVVEPDFFEVDVKAGDRVLLCSDGLSNMLEDAELLKVVGSIGSLEEKANLLVDAANENGGKDNISVVLVELSAE
ncbi:MAG: Stp1/IreP family PP2C-type Ser/Thr phosphatase [Lachnospiraceae bacterium]|nr:Stp1/IreP family PP2C-type Ser/Thr phosphatase [Lachnospiraceae bacterium]MBQ2099477.1 Stp1/IreP family PP2C-type Ser/Thr phosphatase [Lachnospiraceae bacterium]MBQ3906242.1 Stp1/IreP family PP2C-type Ser/Thr phosphatase [Lachnospiraceae bacterium]MCR4599198.1 Stp1/IreP family PP2C-type Ser/Thr phosphatase [Acetatifactor sp.]